MKAYVCDGKVFLANDITIFAWKNGKRIYFEAPVDLRKAKVYIKNSKVLENPNKKKRLRARMSLEERLAIAENEIPQDIIEFAKTHKARMTIQEKIKITHELNTNLIEEERKKPIVYRYIGDYEYIAINFGMDNYYFIKKKKIKGV